MNISIGKIKIWDLQAALDPRSQPSSLCIRTLTEHTGRVFRLQFDDFQIVSSSHDDTILCFNFLQNEPDSVNSTPILGQNQTNNSPTTITTAAAATSFIDQDAEEIPQPTSLNGSGN